MLQKFVKTGKQCGWSDLEGNHLCTRDAVKSSLPIKGKTILCLRHQLAVWSGRVSNNNRQRDHYREYLKPVCAQTGKTWCQEYQEVKRMAIANNAILSKVKLIQLTCQGFQVDHKDGNHNNNDPSNLQTLTPRAHQFKSMINGDFNPIRRKRAV